MNKPEGILITMPVRFFSEYPGGEKQFRFIMERLNHVDIPWGQTIANIPKHEVLYCYLVFGGKVQYRLNIMDYERNVSKEFDENLEAARSIEDVKTDGKTLNNTTADQAKDNVKDIIFWGNGDMFKLLCKASSKNEGWMKSSKAMEIPGIGCVVQVTTQQGDNVAEAVTFVPGAVIHEEKDEAGKVTSRSLVQLPQVAAAK